MGSKSSTTSLTKPEIPKKPLQERLNEKLNDIIKLQDTIITIDAGGVNIPISTNTITKCKLANLLQKEYTKQLNSKQTIQPIFLDISPKYFNHILNIMRLSITTPEDKNMHIVIDVDRDILCDELRKFFYADKIIDKCNFTYATKELELIQKLKEDKKTKDGIVKIWDKQFKIKCYICGKMNDGTYNRINFNKPKNDDYGIDGYFATCKKCDPKGKHKL